MNNKNLLIAGVATLGLAAGLYKYYSTAKNGEMSDFSAPKPESTTTATTGATEPKKDKHHKKEHHHHQRPQINFDSMDIEELNKQCGFCRHEVLPENRKSLENSIHNYDKHFFLCTGTPCDKWSPKYFVDSPLLESIGETLKKHKNLPFVFNGIDMPSKDTSGNSIDIIVFPEMIKFVGVTAEKLDRILAFFDSNRKPSIDQYPSDVNIEIVSNKFIFVCAHKQKDARCGFCGTILIDDLKKEISKRSLDKEIQVFGSTHVGGHKYAGNALVFPPGNWYGYVTPADINHILDSAVSGEIYKPLLRGSMGVYTNKEEH